VRMQSPINKLSTQWEAERYVMRAAGLDLLKIRERRAPRGRYGPASTAASIRG